MNFYDSVIAYIDKWFDFSPENEMVKLKLSFTDLEHVVAAPKMTGTVSISVYGSTQTIVLC